MPLTYKRGSHANTFKADASVTRHYNKRYGKVVDEFDMTLDGQHYIAELRYGKGRDGYQFTGICQLSKAVVVGDNYYAEVSIVKSGADGNTLVNEVFEELKSKKLITWEPFIHITVNTESAIGNDYKNQAGFGIGHMLVLVGTRSNGSKCWQEAKISTGDSRFGKIPKGDLMPIATHVEDGLPQTGKSEEHYGHGAGESFGLIPYTPANIHRLNEIIKALGKLSKQVAGFITGKDPTKIVAALGGPLLTFTENKK
jgi:hypothetical protein